MASALVHPADASVTRRDHVVVKAEAGPGRSQAWRWTPTCTNDAVERLMAYTGSRNERSGHDVGRLNIVCIMYDTPLYIYLYYTFRGDSK